MTVPDDAILRILAIGHDVSMHGEGLSLNDAMDRARYAELRPAFGACDLLPLLRRCPEIVEQWIAYSEDKRTDGGWYLLRSSEIGTLSGIRQKFDSIESAVAEYVIRELDAAVCARSS